MQRDAVPSWSHWDGEEHLPGEWWGPVGATRTELTIDQLIENGTLTHCAADVLGTLVASGRSLAIASGRSGAGKTTLLTALLPLINPTRRRVFARGSYETFNCLSGVQSVDVTLLANEISPHLPIYCWGESLRRLLTAHARGYQVLSTMHADSAEEVRSLLLPFSSGTCDPEVASDLTVAFISQGREGTEVRRVVSSIEDVSLRRHSGVGETLYRREMEKQGTAASSTPFLGRDVYLEPGH